MALRRMTKVSVAGFSVGACVFIWGCRCGSILLCTPTNAGALTPTWCKDPALTTAIFHGAIGKDGYGRFFIYRGVKGFACGRTGTRWRVDSVCSFSQTSWACTSAIARCA